VSSQVAFLYALIPKEKCSAECCEGAQQWLNENHSGDKHTCASAIVLKETSGEQLIN
jgi:hypothetical protein